MSYLARAIEAAGIPTVAVFVEAFGPTMGLMKPPRVLLTPFPLGRPLGLPHDRARQSAVVEAALHLLEKADGRARVLSFEF